MLAARKNMPKSWCIDGQGAYEANEGACTPSTEDRCSQ